MNDTEIREREIARLKDQLEASHKQGWNDALEAAAKRQEAIADAFAAVYAARALHASHGMRALWRALEHSARENIGGLLSMKKP